MAAIDVFNTNAFGLVKLTTAFNKLPARPARIGQMGLFKDVGSTTRSIFVEEKDGVLSLLETKPVGSPGTVQGTEKRTVRSIVIDHIPHDDYIKAESIQGVRAFGSESELQSMTSVVNERLQRMRMNHELTWEHMRAGALQGKVYDANGTTVLHNWFTIFGVTETSVDFVLGTPATEIKDKVLTVIDAIDDALGGAVGYEHIHALCGGTWWKAFIKHALVKAAFDRFQSGEFLRQDPRAGFQFAGITWERYNAKVGSRYYIPQNNVRFFPVGVPEMYKKHNAPADFNETVNTVGLPLYAKQEIAKFGRGVELHTQSNPLLICHRPLALVKGTTSN